MVFFERTKRTIISNSLDKLSETTNISQLAPGSKARFVLDTIAEEQENQHRVFDTNLMQAFVKYSNGKFLDFFGDMMNLPRNPATFAESDEQNFMFYVSTGTFGDINSGANFIIQAGTTVQTVPYEGSVITPGIESQPTITYQTTQDVTCIASQSFVYVPVRATIEGRNSDVPRNVLNQHNFTSYIESTAGNLKCTNQYAISNGEDRESDDSYRFRLASVFEARSLSVFAAIRLAALSIPGVSDIKEVMCEQGPGTYSIYVKGFTPTTSPRLLREVAAACQLVSSYGIRPFVLAPPPLGTEFVAAVSWNPKATEAQIAEGYRNMRNSLERYMNTTDIGQSVLISDLIDVMLQSTPYAFSIGANNSNEFEEVYIYRSDPLRNGTVRNIFSGNTIEPLYNERVILETSGRHRGIQFITRSNT
jgi:uncharacterized phage protein gp47/JayE